ncbi:hypothetical protein [Intestinibacter bartlettii]|uniref:Uncharacterized protein n=1 Tax=Intestinibacter bartlettii TaxID=261299 RepID=A0ABS6DY11_9FIRM|nr:hypothetical protein [Intestinibacter bartlettii]MBU5336635.1 hypothetical protein [Intestinibacter bartlettii]
MFTDKYNTLWAYDGVPVIKVGDNILAQNVIGYGAKDNHISYLTIDGDLYLYDTDSLEETLILQDASDFS